VFHDFKWMPCFTKRNSVRKKDVQFDSGYDLIDKRLDLVYIVSSMQKMMSSISVLLNQHPQSMIDQIKQLNIHKQTIWKPEVDAEIQTTECKYISEYFDVYDYLNNSDEDEEPHDTFGSANEEELNLENRLKVERVRRNS
jgi:hypothetical protein